MNITSFTCSSNRGDPNSLKAGKQLPDVVDERWLVAVTSSWWFDGSNFLVLVFAIACPGSARWRCLLRCTNFSLLLRLLTRCPFTFSASCASFLADWHLCPPEVAARETILQQLYGCRVRYRRALRFRFEFFIFFFFSSFSFCFFGALLWARSWVWQVCFPKLTRRPPLPRCVCNH